MTSGNDVLVEIADQLRGHMAPRDLIRAVSTVIFRLDCPALISSVRGTLFRVACKAYSLELGFTNTDFYIVRNNSKLEVPIKAGRLVCFANWQPTQLELALLEVSGSPNTDEMEKRLLAETRTLQTPSTIPPHSLLNWARRQNILETRAYESTHQFGETIVSSLQSIPDKVRAFGMQNSFWDKAYDGQRVVSRRPKHEPDIQPAIQGLLQDICLAKNVHVSREYRIAGGQLDFLFSSHLSSGETVNVCAEFKHAHSGDRLLHGLQKQLPTYMQAIGCDFGLYCVMWFKGLHFSEPREYQDYNDLKVFLDAQMFSAGITNVRILVMDFSYRDPPSKL